jgi:cyclic 2,3-diphosphoglycerate synthetase
VKALALIDGEHHPDVVRVAFVAIPHEVLGAVLVGGSEKLRGDEDYGVPLYDTLEEGIEATRAEAVVDLSDEPVLDPRRRFELASRALAAGLSYVGADFRFDPVRFEPFELPALAVIGTGKRVGKTAVAGHVARVLARDREVVIVAMGRGGPREPVVAEPEPALDDLLALSRSGVHAASDYLEDAAMARVTTVGARRCGGGFAGAPFFSNLQPAARLAASLAPDLVVFEGSGAALPPVATGARILVAGAGQDPETITGYLGAYRLLLSDLVILTGCEEPLATDTRIQRLRAAIDEVKPGLPVIESVFRPQPVEPDRVAGRRVAFFSTAPDGIHARLREHLAREHGAEIVLVSGNLGRRQELRADLASVEARSAEVYLVELKAAAIDVVAETAAERGVDLVLCDNDLRPLRGDHDFQEIVLALAERVAPRIPV